MNIDVPSLRMKVHRRELTVPCISLSMTYVVHAMYFCVSTHISISLHHALGTMHRLSIHFAVGFGLQHVTLDLAGLSSRKELSQLLFAQSRHLMDIGSRSAKPPRHHDLFARNTQSVRSQKMGLVSLPLV